MAANGESPGTRCPFARPAGQWDYQGQTDPAPLACKGSACQLWWLCSGQTMEHLVELLNVLQMQVGSVGNAITRR